MQTLEEATPPMETAVLIHLKLAATSCVFWLIRSRARVSKCFIVVIQIVALHQTSLFFDFFKRQMLFSFRFSEFGLRRPGYNSCFLADRTEIDVRTAGELAAPLFLSVLFLLASYYRAIISWNKRISSPPSLPSFPPVIFLPFPLILWLILAVRASGRSQKKKP